MSARCSLLTAALLMAACGPNTLEPVSPRLSPEGETQQQPLMYGGHDYLFVRSARNWWDAAAACEALGYGLVTINDASEEAWLHSFEGTHLWWIGYTDQQAEGSWRWRHGSSSYTHWASGQPDDWSYRQDCATDNWSSGRWDDAECDTSAYFICESLQ